MINFIWRFVRRPCCLGTRARNVVNMIARERLIFCLWMLVLLVSCLISATKAEITNGDSPKITPELVAQIQFEEKEHLASLAKDELDAKVSGLEEKISNFESKNEKQQKTIEILKNQLLLEKRRFLEREKKWQQDSSFHHMQKGGIDTHAITLTSNKDEQSGISLAQAGEKETLFSEQEKLLHEEISQLQSRISQLIEDNERKTIEIGSIGDENRRLRAENHDQNTKIDALQSEVENSNFKIERLVKAVIISKKQLKQCSYYFYSNKKKFQTAIESMRGTMNSVMLQRDNCKDVLRECEAGSLNMQGRGDVKNPSDLLSDLRSLDESITLESIVEYVTNPPAEHLAKRLCDVTREKLQIQPSLDQYESLMNTSNGMRTKLDMLKVQLTEAEKSRNFMNSDITSLKSQVSAMHEENAALVGRVKSAEVMSRLLIEDLQIIKEFRSKSMNMSFSFIPNFANSISLQNCVMGWQSHLKFVENMEQDLLRVSEVLDLDNSQQQAIIERHQHTLHEMTERAEAKTNEISHLLHMPVTLTGGTDSDSLDRPFQPPSSDVPSAVGPSPLPDAVVAMDAPVVQSDVFASIVDATNAILGNSVISSMCLPAIDAIKKAIDQAQETADRINRLYQKCQEDLNTMKSEKDAIAATASTLQTSLTAQIALVNSLRTQIANLNSAHAAEKTRLETNIATLEASIQAKDETLARANDEITRLGTVISSLKIDKTTLQSSLNTCNQQLSDRSKEIGDLTNAVNACKGEKETLSQQNINLSLTVMRLESSVRLCGNEKSTLQNQINTQLSELMQCKTDLGNCTSVEYSCTQNLKSCTKSNANLESELVNASILYTDLETKFSNMRDSIDGLNTQFSALLTQAESCKADSNSIMIAKEQLAALLLQYQTNITIIDESYNQLVLEELKVMNTSLHQCGSDILRLQGDLSTSVAQLKQTQVDCQNTIENITTQMSGDCGERESFLQGQLQTMYDKEDLMQAAIDRALLLSTAANASIILLSNVCSFTSQMQESTMKEQNITNHLMHLYDNEISSNVTSEIAVGYFIIESADVIFATPSSGKMIT